MSGGWGEPGGDGEGEHISGEMIPLGNGSYMRINGPAIHKLLHSEHAVRAITRRAHEIAEAANSLVSLDADTVARLSETQDGPAYTVTVSNDPSHTRARAHVRTNGVLGELDQAHNLSLLKAMDQFPSDPKPHGVGGVAAAEEAE